MGMLNFEPQVCGKIRGYIGHYLNSELLVETNIEVLQHLSYCQSCATFYQEQIYFLARLKETLSNVEVPESLENRIRSSTVLEKPTALGKVVSFFRARFTSRIW